MGPIAETIALTQDEALFAAQIGCARAIADTFAGCQHRYGYDGEPFGIGIAGCFGELATAKYFDRYWAGAIGGFALDDVGQHVQVRASNHPNANLIVHPANGGNKRGDKPDDYFICARVALPAVHLMGWMLGADAQLPTYWCEPQPGRPCFLIPVASLRPMSELRLIVDFEREGSR